MGRLNLSVPYSEKDEAKRLGARWDASLRLWFVPEGVEQKPFQQWKETEPVVNIRAARYFIASTARRCWKCGELTTSYTFGFPGEYEVLEVIIDDDAPGECLEWVRCDRATAFCSYVTYLHQKIADRIQAFQRTYYRDFSQTTRGTYWMNHCTSCGMKQGDFQLHEEPGGGFFPTDAAQADRITIHAVQEPFECNGNMGFVSGFDFLPYVRRA